MRVTTYGDLCICPYNTHLLHKVVITYEKHVLLVVKGMDIGIKMSIVTHCNVGLSLHPRYIYCTV